MTPTVVPTCRCGTAFDRRGMCLHCDVVRLCPNDCAYCRWRDHHCAVCWGRCPTVTAAKAHAEQCRAAEQARERKTQG